MRAYPAALPAPKGREPRGFERFQGSPCEPSFEVKGIARWRIE